MSARNYVYLDHAASTPVDPRVLDVMLPYWTDQFGNPSSAHRFGRAAERALTRARTQIAELIGAEAEEIVFTGCGSESDNLALRGVMGAVRANGSGRNGNHMIVSAIEHSAILNTARDMQAWDGYDATILSVNRYGQIRLDELEEAIRPETVLISIMAANNEIGTLQPIEEIGRIARNYGVVFHTDAIQAAATRRWNVNELPIDLISFAPHKFYGPKGIGFLFARQGVNLRSTLTGGSQESGRRAGTENVAFAVGAAEAFRIAMEELDTRKAHYLALRDRLIEGLLSALPEDCVLTGHPVERLPHNASFAFRGVNGNDLLMHLDMAGVSASSGSACKVGDPKPSATLEAIGLDPTWTKGGLRLTVGAKNTAEEIDFAIETIPGVVRKLQEIEREFA